MQILSWFFSAWHPEIYKSSSLQRWFGLVCNSMDIHIPKKGQQNFPKVRTSNTQISNQNSTYVSSGDWTNERRQYLWNAILLSFHNITGCWTNIPDAYNRTIKCIAVPQSIDLWSTCKVAEKHRSTSFYLYIFIVHYYKHYTNIIWHYNVVQSNLRFLASF